ncbi:hypothetical protein P154DRAFT_577188 [Amniculicola lignicola CBS 123094]|uniref:Uncharacterized protein n=1 Tax=Amniculicola lignicola CBS 123094 TaxID=1392246 RepID=A0A6A5WNS5_9PLEO|nr:hypothetical protein P154DRAFT_577188 [Amniculicola lignicola CBS 123094]
MNVSLKAEWGTHSKDADLNIGVKVAIVASVIGVLAIVLNFKAVKRFFRKKFGRVWHRLRGRVVGTLLGDDHEYQQLTALASGELPITATAVIITNAPTPDIDVATQQDEVLEPPGPIPRAFLRGDGRLIGDENLIRAWLGYAAFMDMPGVAQRGSMFDVELQEGIGYNPWV